MTTREKYVTDLVASWIANDGEYYGVARALAESGKTNGLRIFLSRVIRTSRDGSAAREVFDEMAHNDFDRVDWLDVASALTAV